ncbi:MAG: menaquinone biosynthesis protein [Phycisphaerales bacterium]|nr:menaquinone biosynthesis protein [Phycisphaerales bacterium]
MHAHATAAASPSARTVRLGIVSFLNTLPLVDGLEGLEGLHLRSSVPSLLIDHLLADEVDVALCSSIDVLRSPDPLVVLPCGMLGCDGPTLTVRLYAKGPIEAIERVYCDTDSHTSVALLRILLREVHGIAPEFIDYNAREHVAEHRPLDWPEAMLLIGDKVVTDSPPAVRYPHQMDLGAAWREHTGLPFVFAIWMARASTDAPTLRRATLVLDRQRRHNRERIDRMVVDREIGRRWPDDLARRYLHDFLRYDFDDRARAGLAAFHAKAVEHGLAGGPRPLEFFDPRER